MAGRRGAVVRLGGLLLPSAFVVLLAVPTGSASPAPVAPPPGTPTTGSWFEFSYDIYVDNGFGNYSGYVDSTIESYRYVIDSVAGDNVTVSGHGTWTYSNNNGGSSSGGWTDTFAFSSATRKYLWGFDVNGTYYDPSVWFWVPPSEKIGSVVQILDANYTVSSRSSDVWIGTPPFPRVGVEMDAAGNGARNDDYGAFAFSWTDAYWFDPSTGLLVAEIYTEQDQDAAGNGFRWRELASVTSSSYPIAYDWAALLAVYVGIPAATLAALVSVRWFHRGPRHVNATVPGATDRITVRRTRRIDPYLALPRDHAGLYGPLLGTTLRRAALRKDPIWIATDGGQLLGAMVRDREAKVATLFTPDPAVAQLFRSMHRTRNFFAELPPGAWGPKAQLVDTFRVLELAPIPEPTVDTSFVRPLTADDFPEVVRIAREVYAIPEPKWLRQAFEDGDLAYALWFGGRLAGFAFATLGDEVALLHSLTVRPEFRGRGYARSLMAARLAAVRGLGIPRAIVEISEHNPASLAVAREFGFRPLSTVSYYSRKVKRARPIDRRPA